MADIEYGFRLARVAPLEPDGMVPETPQWKVLQGVQQANIQLQYAQGQTQEVRGDDRLLATIEEDDRLTGVNITLQVATDDLEAKAALVGGTYTPGPPPKYTPRDKDEPAPHFMLELYAARYEEGDQHASDAAGFRKYIFYNCVASGPDVTLQDRNFKSPSYTIKARENKASSLPAYEEEDVDALPA